MITVLLICLLFVICAVSAVATMIMVYKRHSVVALLLILGTIYLNYLLVEVWYLEGV